MVGGTDSDFILAGLPTSPQDWSLVNADVCRLAKYAIGFRSLDVQAPPDRTIEQSVRHPYEQLKLGLLSEDAGLGSLGPHKNRLCGHLT